MLSLRAAFLVPLVLATIPLAGSASAECIALPKPIRVSTANTLNACAAGASQHVSVPARLMVSQGARLLLGGGADPEELVTVERLQPSGSGSVDVTVSTRYAHPSNALVGVAVESTLCGPLCPSGGADLTTCVPACPASGPACVPACASRPTPQLGYCTGPLPAPPPLPGRLPPGVGPMLAAPPGFPPPAGAPPGFAPPGSPPRPLPAPAATPAAATTSLWSPIGPPVMGWPVSGPTVTPTSYPGGPSTQVQQRMAYQTASLWRGAVAAAAGQGVFVVAMRDAPPKDALPRWYFVPSPTWTGAPVAVPPVAQQAPAPSMGPVPCGPAGPPTYPSPGLQPCAVYTPAMPPGMVMPPR